MTLSHSLFCIFLSAGNLWHLIVEACIARNLLDTSAYSWPGYVNACSNQIPCSISSQVDGWFSLMKGSQLTPALVNVLVATPASRYARLCVLPVPLFNMLSAGQDLGKVVAWLVLI